MKNKKKFTIIILLFVSLMIAQNSEENKEIKIFSNVNKPTVKEIDIKFNELYRIGQDNEEIDDPERLVGNPGMIDFDSEGNLYVLDVQNTAIKKFNRNGDFIRSFGNAGTGPGEMRGSMSLAIIKDLVYVDDPATNKMVIFDTDGKFIKNKIISSGKMPQDLKTVSDDKFLSYMYLWYDNDDGRFCNFNLTLTDKDFNVLKVLRKSVNKYDPDNVNWSNYFTAHRIVNRKNRIFVAENSRDIYKINIFDLFGKQLEQINKGYRKVRFSKKEKAELLETRKIKANSYKVSIVEIHYDKYDNLWVRPAIESNQEEENDFIYFDIFKDGKFLKNKKIDICSTNDKLFIHDDRIYVINIDQEALIIYEYEIEIK